jgi:O-methyltransferase
LTLLAKARGPAYRTQLGLIAAVNPGKARLLRATEPYAMTSQRKRLAIYREATRARRLGLQGDVLEIGVFRGGSAGILAWTLLIEDGAARRRLHLFDSWGQRHEPGPEDGETVIAAYRESLPEIEAVLRGSDPRSDVESLLGSDLGVPPDRVEYYEGLIEETLGDYRGRPIAFAHIDADLYSSTKAAFSFLDEHLADRALVVLDDWLGWPGVERAFEAYRESTSRILKLRVGRDQAVIEVGAINSG